MRTVDVLVVEDPAFGPYLDALRLVANPRTRLRAHVTVRGPYVSEMIDVVGERLAVELSVGGRVGRFYNQGRHAIFLPCDGEQLREMWDKPDFPGYSPHISVYHGMDIDVANDVQDLLGAVCVNVTPMRATGLVSVGLGTIPPAPAATIDPTHVLRALMPGLSWEKLAAAPWRQRRSLFDYLVSAWGSVVSTTHPLQQGAKSAAL